MVSDTQPKESHTIAEDNEADTIELDDNDDGDITIEEGLRGRELQDRLNACLFRKERREKAWAKQNSLVNQQNQFIAQQQAKLVEMQAAADTTLQQVRDEEDSISELLRRLLDLNSRTEEGPQPPVHPYLESEEGHAADCLGRTWEALRNFGRLQNPAVQDMLATFFQ